MFCLYLKGRTGYQVINHTDVVNLGSAMSDYMAKNRDFAQLVEVATLAYFKFKEKEMKNSDENMSVSDTKSDTENSSRKEQTEDEKADALIDKFLREKKNGKV